MMRTLLLVSLLVLVALPASAAADELSDLRAAQERWVAADIHDYTFRIQIGCFCPTNITKPRDVKVSNDKPVDPPKHVRSYSTVPRLFRVVQHAINADAASLTVTYGKTGLPRRIFIDYDEQIADEELGLTASRLRPQ
jgi:hypothetical protein